MTANSHLSSQIEAVLFVAAAPVSLQELSKACQSPPEQIQQALEELGVKLGSRGLQLISSTEGYSLVTSPDSAQVIKRFLEDQSKSDLSKPALETLAVVAFRQPVTKSQINDIRGVASDQSLKNLLLRGLIVQSGTRGPERSPMYATSHRFLQLLGLGSLNELPGIDQLTGQSS